MEALNAVDVRQLKPIFIGSPGLCALANLGDGAQSVLLALRKNESNFDAY